MFERLLVNLFAVAFLGIGCVNLPVTQRALSLAREHREEDAVRLLREHVSAHPGDVDARRLLIRLLASQGDFAGARDEIERLGRSLQSDDPSPWVELGHAYELTHRFEDALQAYDTAAERYLRSPAGPREGGLRAAHWGEAESARPRLEEAVRRGAADAETFHALGLVDLNLGDLDAAEKAYRSGVAADKEGIENWLGLATVSVVRQDPTGALKAYDAILTRDPNYADAELGRAWALARLHRYGEADKALDRAESMGGPRKNIDAQRAALREILKSSPK